MKKIMFIGKSGCGKTTLAQAIKGLDICYKKTQAVTFAGTIVDTPGEFTENRRFYPALMATASQCDLIGFVQDATDKTSIFPPRFATMFNRVVIGIVSKTDLVTGNAERSRRFLCLAGVSQIIETSAVSSSGITSLKTVLDIRD
jgi:ethanolamine utilization protein EutP